MCDATTGSPAGNRLDGLRSGRPFGAFRCPGVGAHREARRQSPPEQRPAETRQARDHPRRRAASALIGLLLVGCATVPTPATQSPDNPAHPAAPEAVTPPASPELGSQAPEPEPEEPEERATVTYTCPMHPHVASDSPGSCPVCGMALVPKDGGGSR